jgi:CRISPR-associated endonuclease/helicase Cas3
MSWEEHGLVRIQGHAAAGQRKRVRIEPAHMIGKPDAIAARALAAAHQGAKVLVVRNLVADAIAVARVVQVLNADPALLFAVRNVRTGESVPTLHHGRFARADRRILDAAVEQELGKDETTRPRGGLVVIGTQTLEQSLDIDADIIMSDLAPVDVLLQRIGRLHRHERPRPFGFKEARAVILVPHDFSELLARLAAASARGGIWSGPHGLGGVVYGDLVGLAATRRLIAGRAEWEIPAMNRALVEAATHPQRLEGVAEELVTTDSRWGDAAVRAHGTRAAAINVANAVKLDFAAPVSHFELAEGKVGPRLGLDDRELVFAEPPEGPFGQALESVVIPSRWLQGVPGDALPADVALTADGFTFRVGPHAFQYGRFGLERV